MNSVMSEMTDARDANLVLPSRLPVHTPIFARLKRHPFSVIAFFHCSLVITYAFPAAVLEPLLPPGLILDTWNSYGFLAIAMVQTERLRPTFLPRMLGQNFFLSGYRIFTRFIDASGRTLRGLRILRSDTDRRLMKTFGNVLTHYNYRLAKVDFRQTAGGLEARIETPRAEADLHVVTTFAPVPSGPPTTSPFSNLREARRFAGPLPFTFDYERETHSIIVIEGVRRHWKPVPVNVQVLRNTFLERPPFSEAEPLLANAFVVRDVPYRWTRGVVQRLS
jgi:hypothetical protein